MDYKWELYDVAEDFSQANDLAAKMPDKLKEMQAAVRRPGQQVPGLPARQLRVAASAHAAAERAPRGASAFSYRGVNLGIPVANAPALLNRDYTITASVTLPHEGAEGMIATMGGRFGGYGLYLQKGKPVFVYNLLNLKRTRFEGGVGGEDWPGRSLSPGKHTIVFDFKYDGPGLGKGGTGTLTVDGRVLSRQKMEHTIPFLMTLDETLDIGADTRSPVDDGYALPFNFTGTIDEVAYRIGPEQLTAADVRARQDAMVAKSTGD